MSISQNEFNISHEIRNIKDFKMSKFSIAIEIVSSRDYFGNPTKRYRAFLQHQTEYINEKSQDEKKVSVHLPNYLHHSRSFSFQSFDDPLKKFHSEANLDT